MTVERIIIFIGVMNLTLLGFLTPALDGELLAAQDPLFFSWSGVLIIALWGLAYIAVAPHWQVMGVMLIVFALEKALFAWRWADWMLAHGGQLGDLYRLDPMVALFYSGYGPWDAFCAVVFVTLALKAGPAPRLPA